MNGFRTGRIDHVAFAEAIGLWSGATVTVARTFDVTLGIDYQPTTVADRWRFSLGVARKFDLPLPMRRPPAVTGLAFEDRNGNRVRDPGKSTLQGITVHFGPLRSTTDPREQPAANAVVSLVGPGGEGRDVAVDESGHASFTGIESGTYTLTVHPAATRLQRAQPIRRDITVRSGDTRHEAVAVPVHPREIRMPGGGTLRHGTGQHHPLQPGSPLP